MGAWQKTMSSKVHPRTSSIQDPAGSKRSTERLREVLKGDRITYRSEKKRGLRTVLGKNQCLETDRETGVGKNPEKARGRPEENGASKTKNKSCKSDHINKKIVRGQRIKAEKLCPVHSLAKPLAIWI